MGPTPWRVLALLEALGAAAAPGVPGGRVLYESPDLSAPHPIDASCVLERLPEPWAARIYFFSYVASDLFHMLAHALRYYRRLGVDFAARSKFVVHNASGPDALAKSATYLDRYQAPFEVSNTWSSATKREAVNGYLASLPADAWLIYPDLDEFFAYPCELGAVMRNHSFLSGVMRDRVAFDFSLNSLATLPPAKLETNRTSIAAQFPRVCALTEKLFNTNANKYTLVPARDIAGKPVAYINAHSVACGALGEAAGRRLAPHHHVQRANGCDGVVVQRGPDIAHYGFTKATVPMMERKLQTYRDLYAANKKISSLDAVAHYEALRDNFEWCEKTHAYQFTAPARKALLKSICDPLEPAVAADHPAPDLCLFPTPRPATSSKRKEATPRPTPRPRSYATKRLTPNRTFRPPGAHPPKRDPP